MGSLAIFKYVVTFPVKKLLNIVGRGEESSLAQFLSTIVGI